MHYFGQAHELNIPVSGQLATDDALQRIGLAFHAVHRRTYGHAMEGDPVEMVNYRVSAVGASSKPELLEQGDGDADALKGQREVFFEDGRLLCPIYERSWLKPGRQIDGPAVVEQIGSTTLLCPRQSARVDSYGNLIITLAEGEVGGQ